MSSLYQRRYNPDVLDCLANLSSDEVFTPPYVANRMLDLLPPELFSDPNTTFLDPACKSGVFLREIAKRLITGLESEIPDINERIEHIYQNQIFGIAITELTSLMSRRTLYYTKYPQTEFSISQFDNPEGKIIYKNLEHTWEGNNCIYCGASRSGFDRDDGLEKHAYNFIHTKKPEEIFNIMKFDVIIGNPPYQLDDGGAQASAKPIYNLFIEMAKKLNPNYLVMIVPSRWFAGGKGLDSFRKEMIKDKRMKEIHDYFDASALFPGVEIKGGVNYFLWDRNHNGDCTVHSYDSDKLISKATRALKVPGSDIFIRYNEGVAILDKVKKYKELTFDHLVSSRKPFGLATNFNNFSDEKKNSDDIEIFARGKRGWLPRNYPFSRNRDWIDKWKVYIPVAIGSGDMKEDRLKPILGAPNTCSTETYLLIGPFDDKEKTENIISYMRTKFFHFLLGLKKITQHTTSKVYEFIPIQDFDQKWTDDQLYTKYGLTDLEIIFIESTIGELVYEEDE